MTNTESRENEEKCEGWIVLDGAEVGCQWNLNHLGCHSGYTEAHKKVKWETKDREKAELENSFAEYRKGVTEMRDKNHAEITALKAENERLNFDYKVLDKKLLELWETCKKIAKERDDAMQDVLNIQGFDFFSRFINQSFIDQIKSKDKDRRGRSWR